VYDPDTVSRNVSSCSLLSTVSSGLRFSEVASFATLRRDASASAASSFCACSSKTLRLRVLVLPDSSLLARTAKASFGLVAGF
jgi:hypothetical protein